MDSLTSSIIRCNLKLALDNPTGGFGDCFPNSIVQQCRRPEVKTWLMKHRPIANFTSAQTVRLKVTTFALDSREQAIVNLRTKYEIEIAPVDKKSWKEYWDQMGRRGTWVDHIFIQMTAWFMNLDILILTTSSQSENPFIHISGNIKNTLENISGPPLILGNYTNVHYQSLIPHKQEFQSTANSNKQEATDKILLKEAEQDEFIFLQDGMTIIFKSSQLMRFTCPFCNQELISLGKHINNKSCQIHKLPIDKKQFDAQLESFKEGFRLEMNRKRKQKSRIKLLKEKGPEIIKAEMNKQKIESRKNLRDKKRSRDHQSRNEQTENEKYSQIKTRERSKSCNGRIEQTKG